MGMKEAGALRRMLRGSEHVLAFVGRARGEQKTLQVGTVYMDRRAVGDHTRWGWFPEGSLLLYRSRRIPDSLGALLVRGGAVQEVALNEVAERVPWERLLDLLGGRVARGEGGYRTRDQRQSLVVGRDKVP